MTDHPYGWLSLLPSFVAIVLAIATRRVVTSMLAGIAVGALITRGGNLVAAISDTCELHLWHSLVQESRLRVFGFTILMGAMVGVVERAGGMQGLVNVVARWAYNRRRGQLVTWFLGLMVFFDDYANSVLLGNTLQPLCQRLRISKAKLAYLVDSTAAPVAGLALISTWVAGEIDFVQSGLNGIHQSIAPGSAFTLFIQSLPYRFYPLWALLFVLFIGFSGRDFGPMLAAERQCLQGGDPGTGGREPQSLVKVSGWWNAVIPIAATVGAVLGLLHRTGTQQLGAAAANAAWREIFGVADSYYSLLWGAAIGLITAIALVLLQRLMTWSEIESAVAHGARMMLPAIAVLWLASTLSALTGHDPIEGAEVANRPGYEASQYRLYTGEYLSSLLAETPPDSPADSADATDAVAADASRLSVWLPTIVFLLSCGISFATGTSWGTMAIVMPVAIPLARAALGDSAQSPFLGNPVLAATVGSVLAGSIFGDHCSPISDTTILSSQACGCDHALHVWTQLPYALAVGGISIALGTVPVGWGVSVWIVQPLGILGLVLVILTFGKDTERTQTGEPATESYD